MRGPGHRTENERASMSDLFNRSGAIISDDGLYRYRLWRIWDDGLPIMVWVCQNPSKADASINDPSIVRMMGFARRERFGGIVVMNVFAYRATDERELLTIADPVGPANGEYLQGARSVSLMTRLMVGWGNQFGPKKKS